MVELRVDVTRSLVVLRRLRVGCSDEETSRWLSVESFSTSVANQLLLPALVRQRSVPLNSSLFDRVKPSFIGQDFGTMLLPVVILAYNHVNGFGLVHMCVKKTMHPIRRQVGHLLQRSQRLRTRRPQISMSTLGDLDKKRGNLQAGFPNHLDCVIFASSVAGSQVSSQSWTRSSKIVRHHLLDDMTNQKAADALVQLISVPSLSQRQCSRATLYPWLYRVGIEARHSDEDSPVPVMCDWQLAELKTVSI
jgi:hypothetical protein